MLVHRSRWAGVGVARVTCRTSEREREITDNRDRMRMRMRMAMIDGKTAGARGRSSSVILALYRALLRVTASHFSPPI